MFAPHGSLLTQIMSNLFQKKCGTALVASYPVLTFFLKKVRFSITRRTGLV